MRPGLTIDTFALPQSAPDGKPAVQVTIVRDRWAHHVRLSMDEAHDAYAKLGTALGTLKLGKALAAGDDPRAVERMKLARRAVKIGWDCAGVCAVFDITEVEYRCLAQEVAR